MRIPLFSGKGGVGGIQDPGRERRSGPQPDSFDLETGLFHDKTGDPYRFDDHLAIHKVNILTLETNTGKNAGATAICAEFPVRVL